MDPLLEIDLPGVEARLLRNGILADCAARSRRCEDAREMLVIYAVPSRERPAYVRAAVARDLSDLQITFVVVMLSALPISSDGRVDEEV